MANTTCSATTVSLIGAPTDIGASDRGASMGPEALRVAGIHQALIRHGLEVVDCGNVSGPPNPGLIKNKRLSQPPAGRGLESTRCTTPCTASCPNNACPSCWEAIIA